MLAARWRGKEAGRGTNNLIFSVAKDGFVYEIKQRTYCMLAIAAVMFSDSI